MEAFQFYPTRPFSAEYPGLWIGEKHAGCSEWDWQGYEGVHQDEATAALVEDLVGSSDIEFLVAVLNEWYRQISEGEDPDIFVDDAHVRYRFVYYAG